MREREKEVQRTLATHMRDRDKEREQHKRDEAIQVRCHSISKKVLLNLKF